MTETKASYTPIDPAHLTAEQIEQLRLVLAALSLHQWIAVATTIKQICAEPGYGQVTIIIINGHASRIESTESRGLAPELDPSRLHSLME